jgi:hypothetical protein
MMSPACATTSTTLTLVGRRAGGFLQLAVAAMLRAGRFVTLRARCGCLSVGTIAAPAKKSKWAAVSAWGLRFLAVTPTYGPCHLHLVAALLSNPFVTSESSTPHTEPAVDGGCLGTPAPAVFILLRSSWCQYALLSSYHPSKHAPWSSRCQYQAFYSENEEQESVGDSEMVRV